MYYKMNIIENWFFCVELKDFLMEKLELEEEYKKELDKVIKKWKEKVVKVEVVVFKFLCGGIV